MHHPVFTAPIWPYERLTLKKLIVAKNIGFFKKSSLNILVFLRFSSDFDLRFGFCTSNCIGFTPGTIGNSTLKTSVSQKKIVSNIFVFPEVFEGFGGFRKLREACGKNFHLISCKSTSVVTSYDQKTKKVNEY